MLIPCLYHRNIDITHISDVEDVSAVNSDNLWIWLEGLLEHYNRLIDVCVKPMIFTREMWIKQAESIQVYIKDKNSIF